VKREILHFAIAGVIGLVVDACVLYMALALGSGYFLGRGGSFTAAVWITWRINRRFSFPADPHVCAWTEWWRYLLAMLGGGVVNYAVYSAVVMSVPQSAMLPLYAVSTGSIAGMAINFLTAKLWVFSKRN
jgi:putative flippase GtrA